MFAYNCCLLTCYKEIHLVRASQRFVVQSRKLTLAPTCLLQKEDTLKQQSSQLKHGKLIYEGKLSKRILYLKSISMLSSMGLAASFGYVYAQKGFSLSLAGVGFAFTPFLLSPFVIAWFFKRYVTQLYYNPQSDTYTIHHYGLLLNKKSCTFKRDDVTRSDITSMLNTFTVGRRPFFLHDEDLIDVESIDLYKKMMKLDVDEKKHDSKK